MFTSVDFAVLQIIVLVLMAVVGFVIRQLPGFALQAGPGSTDYITEMAKLHARYDPIFSPAGVGILERAQVFQVFNSAWFSGALALLLVSIVICTMNRMPRLWRQSVDVRVIQPDGFFDPFLPDRARMTAVTPAAVESVLRRHHFRVRAATGADGVRYLYGDRHQYTKLATLFTHMGLILFLVAAAVTSRFGVEEGLVLAGGDSVTVQPIGTPDLLVLKNYGFAAPGLETGQATDFTSDLAVFRDGQLLARKVVRVNDPLTVAGFTFHENGYVPAPVLTIHGSDGSLLWDGPISLTQTLGGSPYATMGVPGRDLGIRLLLRTGSDGIAALLVLPYRATGTAADGTVTTNDLFPMALAIGDTATSPDAGITATLKRIEGATVIIAKKDPGAPVVWFAFILLILGLLITFYLPRRRVWTRIAPDGDLQIVGRSDRYVDFEREFGRLLDDLVRVRSA
ncbi:MAG: cytochrome c biogenesis protein ResB [Candidatus Limnocylindrales bacterium]